MAIFSFCLMQISPRTATELDVLYLKNKKINTLLFNTLKTNNKIPVRICQPPRQ